MLNDEYNIGVLRPGGGKAQKIILATPPPPPLSNSGYGPDLKTFKILGFPITQIISLH